MLQREYSKSRVLRPLPRVAAYIVVPGQAYTLVLLYSPEARHQYAERHRGHAPEVRMNDVFFAVHALLLSLLTLGQAFVYKVRLRIAELLLSACARKLGYTALTCSWSSTVTQREIGQRVSTWARSLVAGILAVILIATVVSSTTAHFAWLDLLYLLSYIKLGISILKLVPQVRFGALSSAPPHASALTKLTLLLPNRPGSITAASPLLGGA